MKKFLLFACIVSVIHNNYASDMDMNALAKIADQVIQRAIVQLKQEQKDGELAKRAAQFDTISKERLEQLNSVLKHRIAQIQIGAAGAAAVTAGFCCIFPGSPCCGWSVACCGCGCLTLSTLTSEVQGEILALVKTPEGRERLLNKTHELLTAGARLNKQRRPRRNSLLQAPGEPTPSASMSDSKTSALQVTGPGSLRHRRNATTWQ